MPTIERKIDGGKLVRIAPVFKGDVLESVRITGDFFVHPEEHLVRIESALAGTSVSGLEEKVNGVCTQKAVQCIGFSARDLYEMLIEAYRKEGKGRWA